MSSSPKKKSPYSPAQIGCRDEGINVIRQQFKQESAVVLDYLKETHHARKIAHMQVHYPSTVSSLEKSVKQPKNNLMTLSQSDQQKSKIENRNNSLDAGRYKDFISTLQSNIHGEHDLNQKKRAHNRLNANKAAVSDVSQSIEQHGELSALIEKLHYYLFSNI